MNHSNNESRNGRGLPAAGEEGAAAAASSDPRMLRLHETIDSTLGTMKDNVQNLSERGERVDNLLTKSDEFGASADEFTRQSRGLERNMWWESWKMTILVIGLIGVLLLATFFFSKVLFVLLVVALAAFGCAVGYRQAAIAERLTNHRMPTEIAMASMV